jgi:acetylornithine deacetylase/succinyl-diaminopimelate desuccinylase-like protein
MPQPIDAVLNHLDADRDGALHRLFTLLRVPSISTDPAYAAEVARAAEMVAADTRAMGFATRVHATPGHPVVVGHRKQGGRPHVVFYGHYDVQPVDPLDLWDAPPFEPGLVDLAPGRTVIRARGACDDKGQMMTFLEACRAWIAVTGSLPVDVSLLLEGEEENGSDSLPAVIEAEKAELKADVALICDTGQWDRETPAVAVSLRGMFHEGIVVTTADRDLHSGQFGGGALNAIRALTKAVAALHADDGSIAIPGFYDGVLEPPADLLAEWKALGMSPETLLAPIGLSEPAGERGRMLIEQVTSRPTCDVNGIWGGYQGAGVKTVIPCVAHAKVSFRLVAGQTPERVQRLFRDFIRSKLPADAKVEFVDTKWTTPAWIDWNGRNVALAREALAEEWGKPAVRMGIGGSIPIVSDIKNRLGLDPLMIGFGLKDDRVHAPNEKYDLSSFQKGARSWARVLGKLAG